MMAMDSGSGLKNVRTKEILKVDAIACITKGKSLRRFVLASQNNIEVSLFVITPSWNKGYVLAKGMAEYVFPDREQLLSHYFSVDTYAQKTGRRYIMSNGKYVTPINKLPANEKKCYKVLNDKFKSVKDWDFEGVQKLNKEIKSKMRK